MPDFHLRCTLDPTERLTVIYTCRPKAATPGISGTVTTSVHGYTTLFRALYSVAVVAGGSFTHQKPSLNGQTVMIYSYVIFDSVKTFSLNWPEPYQSHVYYQLFI